MPDSIHPAPMKVQVAIQGGGAKLVALLAAAEAFQKFVKAGEIELTRVAGTSAGALIAAILATGIRAKDVANLLSEDGSKLIDRVMPANQYPRTAGKFEKWNAYQKMYRGLPLGNSIEFRNILTEILSGLSDKEFSTFDDVKSPELFVIVTNLYEPGQHIYSTKSTPNSDLFLRLIDSCALPFIFRTFRHLGENANVDGGLCENLPVEVLQTEVGDKDNGPILALSLENSEPTDPPSDAFKYTLQLISASINNSMSRARRLLDPTYIQTIKTNIGTLDFEGALNLLKNTGEDSEYYKITKKTEKWLSRVISTYRSRIEDPKIDSLLLRNHHIYEKLFSDSRFKFEESTTILKLNSLFRESEENFRRFDEDTTVNKIVPESERVYCFARGTFFDENVGPLLLPRTWVTDRNREDIDFEMIPALSRRPASDLMKHEIIYFTPPLDPSQNEKLAPYTILQRQLTEGEMAGLKSPERTDYFVQSNSKNVPIKLVLLILYIPDYWPDLEITTHTVHPLDSSRTNGLQGRAIKKQELNEYAPHPLDFKAQGYAFENLGQNQWCCAKISVPLGAR